MESYYLRHKEEVKKKALKYYKKNKKKCLERSRKYQNEHKPDKGKIRYYSFRRYAKKQGYDPDDFKFLLEDLSLLENLNKKKFLVYSDENDFSKILNLFDIYYQLNITRYDVLKCFNSGESFNGYFFDEV